MAESDHNTDLESVLIKLEEEQQRYGLFIASVWVNPSSKIRIMIDGDTLQ